MINSMTAFARAERTEAEFTLLTEIRSYNSRYLDVALRISQKYLVLEDKIKSLISSRVDRGRIEINVQIRDDSDEAFAFEIDERKAAAYHKVLVQLKERFSIDTEIPLNLLAGVEGIIQPVQIDRDMEACWPVVEDCISEALSDLVAMRKREGDFLAKDFNKRLDFIEKSIDQIKKESGGLLSYYQERLKERIAILTQGVVEMDPVRIAQEAAFLVDRSDISEEIIRAKSHIKQFYAIMDSEGPSGRKLNFLLQELNREFNTMGSKAGNADVSHMIVAVKSELEKIREQVQNVE